MRRPDLSHFLTSRTDKKIAENTRRSGVLLTVFEMPEHVMTRRVELINILY